MYVYNVHCPLYIVQWTINSSSVNNADGSILSCILRIEEEWAISRINLRDTDPTKN